MNLSLLITLTLLGGAPLEPPQASAPRVSIPVIEPWLLDRDSQPAHWLGQRFLGKVLYEPINIAIVDRHAKSPEQAVAKLLGACSSGGYKVSSGHSCGYQGAIDGNRYPQIPAQTNTALSDGGPFQTNNHGRLLGPAPYQGGFVFTGGFSRESFNLFSGVFHQFVSFNEARDDFGRRLVRGGSYRFVTWYDLGNNIQTDNETTADHDGKVLVIEAVD